MRHLTDLERCVFEGISLTELRRRREEAARRVAEPAAEAFRKALAAHLTRDIPKRRLHAARKQIHLNH